MTHDILIPSAMLAQAEKEEKPEKPTNNAASELAHLRAKSLTPERRKEIACKAANARWAKEKEEEAEKPPKKRRKKK